MKKVVSLVLALLMCSLLAVTAAAVNQTEEAVGLKHFTLAKTYHEGKFTDIPGDAWYLDAVKTAYGMGLFNGKTETTFDPSGNITVAQSIALAARLHSVYYTGKAEFQQGSPWYQCYLDYALANGIIQGDEFSNYSRLATRREVAYLFAHAFPEEALAQVNSVEFSAIPDVTMAERFGPEVYTLYRAGITGGFDAKGTFSPDSPIRRSHVAAMIVRMADVNARVQVTLKAATLPDTFKRDSERGVETFHHATTTIPTAFGLPKLTDAEIDWLIATEDYPLIAESISTLADAVNYFVRADFTAKDSDYDHYWFSHLSGEQVIAQRGGYCGAMCNATAYLLKGDYEELGFNLIDEHVQMYAKIDGLYYILNPVDYAKTEGAYWIEGWFKGVNEGAILCADNMQTIADSWKECGWTTERFQTYVSPGGMFPQFRKDTYTWVMPLGTHVDDWFGHEVLYAEPEFRRMIGPPLWWGERLPTLDWVNNNTWVDESLIVKH